jgi:hypothetical protein
MSLSLFRIEDEVIDGYDNFAEEDLLVLIAGKCNTESNISKH